MKRNVLVGGEAGQGVNTVAEVLSEFLTDRGYYVFNYKDYPSVIRGGHNFNIVSFSEKPINSFDYDLDILISIDENTLKLHKKQLKKDGIILKSEEEKDKNLLLLGGLLKILGANEKEALDLVKKRFSHNEALIALKKGYNSYENKYNLKKINNKLNLMSGSRASAIAGFNSGVNRYFAYPMTPSTELMNEFALMQNSKNDLLVFQPENEIAVANMGLGASFAGSNVMIGSSGGGFDLMTEALSFQGISEIPLTVYLASRAGPGTGVPTYSAQGDLDAALKGGHGEFPRIVVAPGDAYDSMELTTQALNISGKYNSLSIILSDRHIAESQFSFMGMPKFLKIIRNRKIPSEGLTRASSYEHGIMGETTEDSKLVKERTEARLKKYNEMKKECSKFNMIKIHGNKNSKNLVIGWGSTKGVILDAISSGLDCKFLQVLYLKPMSDKIKSEIEKSKNVYLVEYNSTGQLGRVIREKTGYSIPEKNRILKYDGRPFACQELINELKKRGVR